MASHAEFVQTFVDFVTEDPNAGVFLGTSGPHDRLPDPSIAAAEARVATARALLDELAALPPTDSFHDALDRELMELEFGAAILRNTLELSGRLQLRQLPTVGEDVGSPLFLIFVNDPRPAAERLHDITARLSGVPAFVDAMLERLDTPVARWAKIDVDKVEELPGLFATLLGWADHEGWDRRDELAAAIETAEVALTGYVTGLKALPTTDAIHVGAVAARSIVASKGIDLDLDALHALATDYLAEIHADLDTLAASLTVRYGLEPSMSHADLAKYLDERFAVELEDPSDMNGVLRRYEVERERILAFIKKDDLFPVLDDQDMKIMATPPFMEPSIPAGAMMPPPPLRSGTKTSLVYLTLTPELLPEHTELGIPMMMVHEGIPGHHLQLATAAAHPSPVRRLYDGAHHAEGWTTMLEDYMLDQGYLGELTDEARFSGKRDIARIGARVAIDLFFMTGDRRFLDVGVDCDTSSDDPFEAAGALLEAVTGFVPGRVQAELNWYSQERGYPLSYLTGNRLVWQLKADVAEAQKGRLEGLELDRAFHRVYLESGNMPVRWLWRVFRHEGLLPEVIRSA